LKTTLNGIGVNTMGEISFEPIETNITYEKALELLRIHVKDGGIWAHCRETEVIMRALARRLGQDEEQWAILGLLHDIDFEKTRNEPRNHCLLAREILKDAGVSMEAIEIIFSHAYGSECGGGLQDRVRTRPIEHALVAAETLTGLIFAAALMTPDKRLSSLKPQSLKKKYKSPSFARNCNRAFIAEIELAGIPLDEFFEIGIKAMQEISDEIGL
jgi:putative nucleotidyltransferase with HDIG domain